MTGNNGLAGLVRPAIAGLAALVVVLMLVMVAAPMLLFAGAGVLFANGGGADCADGQLTGGSGQPAVSTAARDSIPADYLALFKSIGSSYGVPWVILAGIGKVESDFGRTTLPGVHSGANAFGAAGPMQIGIGGAAGNTWGGAPVHLASEQVSGVATDADGDGVASVYDPADAIAGAAKYLLAHGVTGNVAGAIFAYNHLDSYVQLVLSWASGFAGGGYTVSAAAIPVTAAACQSAVVSKAPDTAVAVAITFAEQQLGKPYLWGATGPDAYDCSGLVMAAYRAAGVDVPRTAAEQWAWGPPVPAADVKPGDLVYFVADGTATSPGHVGMVIGQGLMIDAPAPGQPVRIAPFAASGALGFTRPWKHPGP